MLKKLLIGLGVAFATLATAQAQVNTVPQVGVTTGYLGKVTYAAGFFGLVPPSSATDVICIAGSASKTVKVQSIKLTGTAGTLVTLPVQVVRRVTVDTGGTAGTTTAGPNNNIAKRDVNSPTATATLISYTAVPTITDSSPTYLDSQLLTLQTTAAGTNSIATFFDYGKDIEDLLQTPTLVGAAAQICVNFNAVSISSGVLNGTIVWTEE